MNNIKSTTIEAAKGKWHDIFVALGIDEKFLTGKHTGCPICIDGIDRFRVDNRDGSGSFICGQCGSGWGMDLLMRINGWNFAEAAHQVDLVVGNAKVRGAPDDRTDAEKMASIKRALKESREVEEGDPVWLYLNRRTGIEIIPPDIRLHHGMRHTEGGTWPVMIAVMRDKCGNGITLHRTYLTTDGKKAPVTPVKKFMPGKRLNGSCVRLSAVAEHIGLAEGIESAMAASMRFKEPVWSSTSAGLMEAWEPPDGVKRITVYGDNDANFVGQAAAYNLARKWTIAGYVVDVVLPEKVGSDWADQCA